MSSFSAIKSFVRSLRAPVCLEKAGIKGLAAGLALALAVAGGCATSPQVGESKPAKTILWPAPPAPPRIAFQRIIERPEDVGATKGIFGMIVEWISGPSNDDILKPYGIAVDGAGRVIVADTAFKRVHIYDMKGKNYSFIEDAGKTRLESPIGVAADGDGNIYVTDSVADKVYAFNSRGKFLFQIEGFERPTGIAVNRQDKKLFVSDTGSHVIKVFDLTGKPIQTIGRWGKLQGEFNYPVDLFVDRNGELYVTDSMNFRVQIFDRNGNFLAMLGKQGDGTGDIGRPKGVSVDKDGHIYVADAIFDTVQIFDRKGNFLLSFGSLGREAGSFWSPSGVFIDHGETVYVSDSYNKRIQVFEYLGSM